MSVRVLQHEKKKSLVFEFLCPSSLYLTATLEKRGFMLHTPLKGVSVVVVEGLESITSPTLPHLV